VILRVSANKPSFRPVEFAPGFNVVWADRTKDSTKKDSRNGLGKSTLIEIIHFCLGSNVRPNQSLRVEALAGWEFTLEMRIGSQRVTVSRSVDHPSFVAVDAETALWPIPPRIRNERPTYDIGDWTILLGHLYYDLPVADGEQKYAPTFRSLISYPIRRHKDAFSTPFEHHRKQAEWDKQVHNAFLLGLAWEDAASFQELKDSRRGLESWRKAAQAGVVKGMFGTLGDLDARKVRLEAEVERQERSLGSFQVHPQYEQIQKDASQLTEEIHDAVNSNIQDRRLLNLYEAGLAEEEPPPLDTLKRLYEEAGVSLPGVALRRYDDVQAFHTQVIENRRAFLASELERLRRAIGKRDEFIADRTTQRAGMMTLLATHGALAEYSLLQKRHAETVGQLHDVRVAIGNLKAFEDGLSENKIAQEVLQQKMRRDFEERRVIREQAILLFNSYSETLYNVPGKLVVDVGSTGFRFDVEIERSGSAGISNMKVFCYDLTLARMWAGRTPSPRLLVHDSTIFDGVDERQRALALETAAKESEAHGFQYICTLNSDYVPWGEFSKGFDLMKYIRLRLTDETVEGCLLGVRF